MRLRLTFLLSTILLFISVIVSDILVKIFPQLYFSKDSGYLFRTIFTCTMIGLFFAYNVRKPLAIGRGFLIGLISYVIYIFMVFSSSLIINRDMYGWQYPLFVDQLCVIVIAVVIIYFKLIKFADS